MITSLFCETCQEIHEYNMYQVVDVVRHPHLKNEFINRNLPTFKCSTCGSQTGLEKHLFFVYWAKGWIGLVIPSVPGTSKNLIQKWVDFLLSHTKEDRADLPTAVNVFGNLDDLLGVITLPECDEVTELNSRKVLDVGLSYNPLVR